MVNMSLKTEWVCLVSVHHIHVSDFLAIRPQKINVLVLIRKKEEEKMTSESNFFFFSNWKINVLVLIRKKKLKHDEWKYHIMLWVLSIYPFIKHYAIVILSQPYNLVISSEKCMYFTCFPSMSIWRGVWLFFLLWGKN